MLTSARSEGNHGGGGVRGCGRAELDHLAGRGTHRSGGTNVWREDH